MEQDQWQARQEAEAARLLKLDAIISGVEGFLTGRLMVLVTYEQSDRGPQFAPKAMYRIVENPDYEAN